MPGREYPLPRVRVYPVEGHEQPLCTLVFVAFCFATTFLMAVDLISLQAVIISMAPEKASFQA